MDAFYVDVAGEVDYSNESGFSLYLGGARKKSEFAQE